jgi:hypothetical protein
MRSFEKDIYLLIFFEDDILPFFLLDFLALFAIAMAVQCFSNVLHRHRGGRISKINAWYLNTHMVYL